MLHTAWVCSIFQKEGTEMQEQVKATFLVNAGSASGVSGDEAANRRDL